jgi:hypothetical protein
MRAACILAPASAGKSKAARMAMTAMTTSNSTSVKAPTEKNFPAGRLMFQAVTRQPVVENLRGIGFAATLYRFRFL